MKVSMTHSPVGFDLEWDMFDRVIRGQGKTALVQVCDENIILLVQVARMKGELVVLLSITRSLLRIRSASQLFRHRSKPSSKILQRSS